MSESREAPFDQPLNNRKARDQALILPIVGLLLLVPPLAGIFQLELRIAGVPFTALYLFGVWALLIFGAAVLSRRLRDDGAAADIDGQAPSDPHDAAS